MHNSVLFLFVYSMHKLVALFLCKEDSVKLKKKVKQTIKLTEISQSTNTHIMKGAHPPGVGGLPYGMDGDGRRKF